MDRSEEVSKHFCCSREAILLDQERKANKTKQNGLLTPSARAGFVSKAHRA
jgi:hypothetical protein